MSRSKKLQPSSNNDSNTDEEDSSDEDKNNDESGAESELGTPWSAEETMKLIRNVYEQLPSNDNLPHNERLDDIDWKKVAGKDYSVKEVKKVLKDIISSQRTYRLLSEVLKDVEKSICNKLSSPRKPVPAFILFVKENKDYLKNRFNTNSGAKSYTHEAAEIFKTLPEEEKEKYRRKAVNLKMEYNDFMNKYNLESNMEKTKRKSRELRVAKESPLSHFLKLKAEEGIELNFGQGRKEYANLDKEEKLKYILDFLDVRKGKKLSMQQYERARKTLTKEELALIDEYEGRPKKLSAYNYFMKEQLTLTKNNKDCSWNEMFKNVVEQWKNLPAEEKKIYEEMSKKAKADYAREYRDYIRSLSLERQIEEMAKEIDKKQKIVSEKYENKDKSSEHIEFKLPQKDKKRQRSKENDAESSDGEIGNTKRIKEEKNNGVTKKELSIKSEESSNTSKKSNKQEKKNDTSDLSTTTKSLSFKKPPSSVFKYYVMEIFDGPKKDAKRAYKSLTTKKKNKIQQKYEKAKRIFLEEFEEFVKSLSPEEIVKYEKELASGSDEDDISDLTTDSESESD